MTETGKKQETRSGKRKHKPVILGLTPQDQKLAGKNPGMILPTLIRLKVELKWMWNSGWWDRSPKGLILALLIFGLLYHVLLTWGGNFIFHIDSARDMIDVREMVVLHHLRLIGPTSGIDGLFTGPGWYYLMAIPFILSGGNPYAEILMMDLFWLIGGFFLLKMLKPYGTLAILVAGSLWITSNYIVLSTSFSFSPNPIILTSPLLIYVLANYLDRGTRKSALALGVLGALFWNLEMAFTIFLPFIIVLALIFGRKWSYFLTKTFWLGVVLPFFAGLLPQLFFELRHNFFMTRNVLSYLTEQKSLHSTFSLSERILKSWSTFQEGFRGTFFNQPFFIWFSAVLFIFLILFLILKKGRPINFQILSALLVAIVPFIGFSLFPIVIQLWHIEASLAALIFLIGVIVGEMKNIHLIGKLGKWLALGVTIVILGFSFNSFETSKNLDFNRFSNDPSEYKNQTAAIDYAYSQAGGKNFKSYVYSPGILDMPYQYNFWWYGQKKYGFVPLDYAYLPNQPEYIKNKAQFPFKVKSENSGLVILIKEPGFPAREDLWKNNFISLQLLKSDTIGPLKLEVRREKQ